MELVFHAVPIRARRAEEAVAPRVLLALALLLRRLGHRVGDGVDLVLRVEPSIDLDAFVNGRVALVGIEAVKLALRHEVEDALDRTPLGAFDVGVEAFAQTPALDGCLADQPCHWNPLADSVGIHVATVGEVKAVHRSFPFSVC